MQSEQPSKQNKRQSALNHTKNLALIAAAVALNAVCAWLTIPFTIPFTLQTFAIFFTLTLLGGKRGTAAILLYLLLGILGAPIFSGFNSGIPALLGPTGGFLIGFAVSSLIYLAITLIFKEASAARLISCIISLLSTYAIGTLWFAFVYSGSARPSALLSALTICVFPYLIPDALKLALALFLSAKLQKHLRI